IPDHAFHRVPTAVDLRRDALDDDAAPRAQRVRAWLGTALANGHARDRDRGRAGAWGARGACGVAVGGRAVAILGPPGRLRGDPPQARTCGRHAPAQTLPHREFGIRWVAASARRMLKPRPAGRDAAR